MTKLPEFTFDTYYTDPLSLNVMTLIQKNWADVGFKVKIHRMAAGGDTVLTERTDAIVIGPLRLVLGVRGVRSGRGANHVVA